MTFKGLLEVEHKQDSLFSSSSLEEVEEDPSNSFISSSEDTFGS